MNEQALDVVVVSAIGVDTNIFLYGKDIDFSVEANFTQNLDYVGQAGGYSSRGFAQLGKRTAFIGYIGDDHNGKLITDELNKDGIEPLLFIDPQGTRRSVNIMYQDGRRKNFYDAKGAMDLQPDLEACKRLLARTKLAHFNIENWARYLLKPAKALGVTISCDIQDIVSVEDAYRQDFIEASDVLFFSAVNHPDPTPLFEAFLRRNPEGIFISGMGSRGCALATKHGIHFFGTVNLPDPVIDTNGAGDGLAVGFLSSYFLDGYNLQDAIMRGQITARYTCTKKASSSRLITHNMLDMYSRMMNDKG